MINLSNNNIESLKDEFDLVLFQPIKHPNIQLFEQTYKRNLSHLYQL